MNHSRHQCRLVRRVPRPSPIAIIPLLALLLPASALQAQQRPLVIRGATVLTGDGTRIERGTIVIQNGKISAVGDKVDPPLLARTLKVKNKYLTPGLIDVHSTFGLDADAGGGTATARAVDAFDGYAQDELKAAFAEGITAIYAPARLGGLGSVVRLRPGAGGDDRVLKAEAAYAFALPADPGAGPLARVRVAEELRRRFQAARDYREAWQEYEENLKEYEQKLAERVKKDKEAEAAQKDVPGSKPAGAATRKDGAAAEPPKTPDAPKPAEPPKNDKKDEKKEELKKPQEPPKDRNLEVLLRVLDGELRLRVEAHDPADILNVLGVAADYNLALILEGGSGAHLVATELARQHVPVVLSGPPEPLAFVGGPMRYASAEAARALKAAGVEVYFGSGTVPAGTASRLALRTTRAAGHGFEAENLLAVVTARAARLLGVEKEIGRLAPGQLADVVLWSDHPFAPGARVERVFVGGVEVYRAGEDDADEE